MKPLFQLNRWLVTVMLMAIGVWAEEKPKDKISDVEPRDSKPGFYTNVNIRPAVFGSVKIKNQQSQKSTRAEFDPGFAGGLAVGYQYKGVRFEVEPSLLWSPFSKINNQDGIQAMQGDVWHLNLMANGVYQYRFSGTPFTPYVGVGAGPSLVIYNLESAPGFDRIGTGTDITLAYQALLGCKFDISDQAQLYGGYRYFSTLSSRPDEELNNLKIDGIDSHQFEGGLCINF